MNIVVGRPPNFEAIAQVLPGARGRETIFTYGDTIYISYAHVLPHWLLEHEAIHFVQQGVEPELWWQTYLAEPKFRFEQELEAHQREYVVAIERGNRHMRRMVLKAIAARLAGPLYGHCCTKAKARRLIQAGDAL
jgi:hypothetical protein